MTDRPIGAAEAPRTRNAARFTEFLKDVGTRYFSASGIFWRTLWVLMSKPGALTQDYLVDRRMRYVSPIRLCAMLALFFVIALQVGAWLTPRPPAVGNAAAMHSAPTTVDCERVGPGCERDQVRYAGMHQHDRASASALPTRYMGFLAASLVVMSPLLAGLLCVVYASRRIPFVDHLVFSLHLHAAWFVGLLVMAILGRWLPESAVMIGVFLLLVYGYAALKRVYQESLPATLMRGTALTVLHGLAIGTVATVAAGLALG